jgi:hypothetical protein
MAYAGNDLSWQQDVHGLAVQVGQFVAVTADGAEHALYQSVVPLLQRLRKALNLDLIFVAQMVDGLGCVRRAASGDPYEAIVAGNADAMEAMVGQGVLLDRGARGEPLSLPVVAKDAREFGTVCCEVQPGRTDLGEGAEPEALFSVARLLAQALVARERARVEAGNDIASPAPVH